MSTWMEWHSPDGTASGRVRLERGEPGDVYVVSVALEQRERARLTF